MALNAYILKRYFKWMLFLAAVAIGAVTLYLSNRLAGQLAQEERKKIGLWAQAQKQITLVEDEEQLNFYLQIIEENTTIPVILTDKNSHIITQRNISARKQTDTVYLKKRLAEMKSQNEPLEISIDDRNTRGFVYYGESSLLRQLRYYPYFALGLVSLFILVSYFAFSYSRKSEQNRVWVGLARETAHQLGTPISSLLAWVDLLEMEPYSTDKEVTDEMRKDIVRLQTITERFSKIGSDPILKRLDLREVLSNAISYLETRSPGSVVYTFSRPEKAVFCDVNVHLFEWVIENLCKNSMDAMEGAGSIHLNLRQRGNRIILDVTDNGKGIPKNRFKTIFKPGYTSKSRGWGLGLSLAKRIIENYHKGHILVKESIPNQKTTIRMVLKTPAEPKT